MHSYTCQLNFTVLKLIGVRFTYASPVVLFFTMESTLNIYIENARKKYNII